MVAFTYSKYKKLNIIANKSGEIRVNEEQHSFRYSTDRTVSEFGATGPKNLRGVITAMTLDPNENYLVIGTKKGWISAFDMDTIVKGKPKMLCEKESHQEQIRQLVVRDREYDIQVISVSIDGTVKIQTLAID